MSEDEYYVVWSRGDESPVKVSCDFLGTYTIEGNPGIFSPSDIGRMLREGVITKVVQKLEGVGDE